MALIKCPECGKEISDQAGACPNCGFPIGQSAPAQEPAQQEEEKKGFFKRLYEQSQEMEAAKQAKKGLRCPKCKSHNIDLWDPNANTKEFHRTGLNLNPLHPLTFTKTKTVKKQKKKHNEYYCRDCGHRWVGK